MIFIVFLRLYNVDRSCYHVAQSRSLLAVRVQGARWERMLTACPLPRTPRASARLAPAPCRAASAQRLPHDAAAVAAVALALEVGAPRAAAAGALEAGASLWAKPNRRLVWGEIILNNDFTNTSKDRFPKHKNDRNTCKTCFTMMNNGH